ncbi:MAG: chemotaxis protein CheB [Nostoc sp. ChiSLP02]|nr:chemotaxis protein CheB [Nostoc sp. DedSLP05]MDZ8101999.1 chemotaxis protein CheB [Nostoc sp. DedSLP01]MDZ8185967.1 chemotaxis protein CheB [Nostoc sp. ChiSLP02]
MSSRRPDKKSQADSAAAETPQQKQQDNQKELFPIVGMGASAGGLEAFTQLLRNLPNDTGMAFVLVQHLSPDYKSMLSEILSESTQMPVHEVEDGIVVEPNHVYVIPPNKNMTIAQGLLKLAPRVKTRGQYMTVDAFFFSLAEYGNKAIAVILSGGDGDGTRGLQKIKEAGGITFAQCEDTAQISSMPNTAVASGYVDFILPPQEIASELAKISRHWYVNPSSVEPTEKLTDNSEALSAIFALLRTNHGVDFSYYKPTTLKRRILRRMVLYHLERLEDYVRYLGDNPTEVSALYQDLLINITSFFRDPEAFEALKAKVFPLIVNGRTPDSPIRVWVAGCSTGQEAYSLAICLLEYLTVQGINPPIQIFATDVNEQVIEKARNGIYKPSQVADVSPARLQRFFVQVEEGYQISKPVRELCVFAQHNLMTDPPFSRLDLITCRNVLIYLGASIQKKLLGLFHYGLKPTGFLMLGTSETIGDFTKLFELVDNKYKIYTSKLISERVSIDMLASPYPTASLSPQSEISENAKKDMELQKQADQIVLNQYSPAGVIINHDLEILQFRGQVSPYLEPAPGKASLNLLKMTKEGLRLELRSAINQAKEQLRSVRKEDLQFRESDRGRLVRVDVIPFKPFADEKHFFLILFVDTPFLDHPESLEISSGSGKSRQRQQLSLKQENILLKQELANTKEYLQSSIKEHQATNQNLKAANEEILSSNEELQSTNEELQTAKEEIQATNEELNTINDELQRRNAESIQASNDLQNVLSSINIPILILESDLRVRRFTPIAARIFNLIPTDVGRPLSDIKHNLNIRNLEQEILEVISTLNLKAQEVQDEDGHWYDLRIRPYKTSDNKIDGAVVVLVDIDTIKTRG